jgi:DNA-binding NtrC family response regulator
MVRRTRALSADDRVKALATREAVIGLHNGSIQPADLPARFPHISRRRATELAGKLPKDLEDDENSLELTRAATKIVGLEVRNLYSTWELQQATAHYVAKKMTAAECTAKYGVGGSTLRRKRKALDLAPKESGSPPSLSVAHRAAKKLKKENTGP